MFNLAIDRKLHDCNVVALKVEDIVPHGYAVERATVRQKKTGVPVRFEVTEQTRQAVDDYIRTAGKKAGEFLFAAPRRPGGAYQPGNMHASSATGFARSVSIPAWRPFAALDQGHADLPTRGKSQGHSSKIESVPPRRSRSSAALFDPERAPPLRRSIRAGAAYSITSSAVANSVSGEAERLGGFEVDGELELVRLHDRQVGRLVAFQNAPSIDASLAVNIALTD